MKKTIGTSPECLFNPENAEIGDILLVNESANDMYLGSDQQVDSDNGIIIRAGGGVYENHQEIEPVFVVAAAAGSDLRIRLARYLSGNILRIEE